MERVTLRPLRDHVLIRPDPQPDEEEHGGGIVTVHPTLPDTSGTIVSRHASVEPLVLDVVLRLRLKDDPLCTEAADVIDRLLHDSGDMLPPGTHVLFPWDAGQEVTLNGERVLLMRAGDVLAIVDHPETSADDHA